jgi:hypothetical protein
MSLVRSGPERAKASFAIPSAGPLLVVAAVEVPRRLGEGRVGRQRITTRSSSAAIAAPNGRASSPELLP